MNWYSLYLDQYVLNEMLYIIIIVAAVVVAAKVNIDKLAI